MTHQDDFDSKANRMKVEAMDDILELLGAESASAENVFASVMRTVLNHAMQEERSQFLQAGPHERSGERRGYANGFKPKTYGTRFGALDLQIPQVRSRDNERLEFYPSAIEKGSRSERALKATLAQMYLSGVSTRRVTKVLEELTGLQVSSTQVSRCTKQLDEELSKWRTRPLGEVTYLLLDARYENVRVEGRVIKCALLIALGVTSSGHRMVLGASVSLSEAEVHWRSFIESLQNRGMHGVRMVVSDNHMGLKAALASRLTNTPWQRCQFHLQQNIGHRVSKLNEKSKVAMEVRGVLDATSPEEALQRLETMVQRYSQVNPALATYIEENVPESLTVLHLPLSHRRLLRTTNGLERLNREVKRRTRSVGVFPDEASLLRLVSAMLMEVSEEWESGRIYLSLDRKTEEV